MTEPGVFLIHGLGGTQYDLGSMHKRLKNAGFVTHSLTLPGHGTKPEDLSDVHAEDWIEAVRSAKGRLRFQLLFYRPAHAKPEQTLTYSVRTPLSCFLVDRGHLNRQ